MSNRHLSFAATSLTISSAMLVGCFSVDDSDPDAGLFGHPGVGGGYSYQTTGGYRATGGAVYAYGGKGSGGYRATGGSPTGGYRATGGYPTGGYRATGGAPTGGYRATGGYPTGGYRATGGVPTGGYRATGGYPTGGYRATGGVPTGGYRATGGAVTGGSKATGGTLATGGVTASGGIIATGGTTITIGSGGVSSGGTGWGGAGGFTQGGAEAFGGSDAGASGGTDATGGTAASGGSTAITVDECPGVDVRADSGSMTVTSGYVQSQSLHGYATTIFTNNEATNTCFIPACITGTCNPSFNGTALCAAGIVGAQQTAGATAFGFTLNQDLNSTLVGTVAAPDIVSVSVSRGAGAGDAAAQLEIVSAADEYYCVQAADWGPASLIGIGAFKTNCPDRPSSEIKSLTAGTPLKQINVAVPSDAEVNRPFSICLTNVSFSYAVSAH